LKGRKKEDMDIKPLFLTTSRDLIVLTSEVARMQATIAHFRQAEISMDQQPTPASVAPTPPKIASPMKSKSTDNALERILSKASGAVSQSEIPTKKRTIDPATLILPSPISSKTPASEPTKLKTPEDLHAAACTEFDKVKRATAQARRKIFEEDFSAIDKLRTRADWASQRIQLKEAPEINDEKVVALMARLATEIDKSLDNNSITESQLESVSMLSWATDSGLLTFWRDNIGSPQIHNA